MIHILIRTHKRPRHFAKCVQSIKKQTYKNWKIHVVTDDMESMDYCREFNPVYVQKQTNKLAPFDRLNGCLYFPQNRYIHELYKEVNDGFIMGLDDDDMLAHDNSLEIIRSSLDIAPVVFWRVNIGGTLIPSDKNFGKHPVVKDISGIGYCYDYKLKEFLLWSEWKQADYRNAATLYDISKTTWVDQVLTKTQSTNHCGASIEAEGKSIVILIPVYSRSEIWELCANKLKKSIEYAKSRYHFDIKVCVLCSKDDKKYKINSEIATKYDFIVAEYKNSPLSEKLNAGVNLVISHFDFDYLMSFGSDNFILPEFWEKVDELTLKNNKFFGSNGFLCIDKKTKRAIKMKFKDVLSGVGRFVHKDILNRVIQYGELYPKNENSGLDTFSQNIIYNRSAQSPTIVDMSDLILDIKTAENINDFDIYEFSSFSSKADYNAIIKKYGV